MQPPIKNKNYNIIYNVMWKINVHHFTFTCVILPYGVYM
jgi:hypothetical protein